MNKTLFSYGNGKLKHCANSYGIVLVSFDLPAGFTCPAANLCHSRAVVDESGKAKVHDFGSFRCYAASSEAMYKDTRAARWRNLESTKADDFVTRINAEIAKKGITSIRIHSSGDFYSYAYLQKWIAIANANPNVVFWGYTKMASFIPVINKVSNMRFVYSVGGKLDKYAMALDIPKAYVLSNIEQAKDLGVEIACPKEHHSNDYEYIMARKSFGLVIHGTQPKGNKKKGSKTF